MTAFGVAKNMFNSLISIITTMNTDQTLTKLNAMKIHGMATFYEGVLSLSAQDQPDAHELAAAMADIEQLFRDDKRLVGWQ